MCSSDLSRRFPVWLNNTGGMVGDYNLTVEVEVLGTYKDENHSNDAVNGSIHFSLREYDLAVELGYLANTLPVNRTIEITVHAFNHGQANLESDAMGAEVAVYINGVELDLMPTGRLGMVTGEQLLVFYWTPLQVGSDVRTAGVHNSGRLFAVPRRAIVIAAERRQLDAHRLGLA